MSAARTVLLTGATGVVGSQVMLELLREPETQIRLIVRGDSQEQVRARIEQLLHGLEVQLDPKRVEVQPGDVSEPQFGLTPEVYQRWIREVTHAIHSAGVVKQSQPMEDARRDAVAPIERVLEFTRGARAAGNFQKLEHVSTIGVCGYWSGTVPETQLTVARRFRNTYEAAKAEAEDLVFTEMERGLAATVHRPSMVVGDSQTGRVLQFQVFYYLLEFVVGARTFGIIPDTGESLRLDLVPVDYVASAIVLSSREPQAQGLTFHLCSGPQRSPVLRTLAGTLWLQVKQKRRLHPLRFVSPRWFELLVWMARPFPKRWTRAMRGLGFFLSYLGSVPVFASHETERFLEERGLSFPSIDLFLPKVVQAYLERPGAKERAL